MGAMFQSKNDKFGYNRFINRLVTYCKSVPTVWFSLVVGTASLAGAWNYASLYMNAPNWVGLTFSYLAICIYIALFIIMIIKWVGATKYAISELDNWITASLTTLFFVATQLIANLIIPWSINLGMTLFIFALCGQLAYTTLYFVPRCFTDGHSYDALTPALYIPFLATNLTSAIVAANIGWNVLGQILVGIAIIAWLILEPIILTRWLFGSIPSIEQRSLLGVETAPPVVVCLAWLSLFPEYIGPLVYACIGWGGLLTLVYLRLFHWWGEVSFSPAFWSFSFGASALAFCSLQVANSLKSEIATYISMLILLGATTFISWLLYKTAKLAMFR